MTVQQFIDNPPTGHEWMAEFLQKETHHGHEIVLVGENETPHWKSIPKVDDMIDSEIIDLNDLVALFHELGWNKNTEEYRHLYRAMGYSLYGYWEVFYWEVNNLSAAKYKPSTKKEI